MTRLLLKTAMAVSTLSFFVERAAAQSATAAVAGAIETLDCYDSLGSISDDDPVVDTFQSSGKCQETCTQKGAKVMITTGGSDCICGDTLPPNDAKVDSDNCNSKCGGFDKETCGGLGYYQFYLTGLGAPKIDKGESSSSSSESSSSQTSSSTSAGQTVVVTAPSQQTEETSSSGGGSSKVGIAVGVVVGVIALAAIAGAGVFFWKRKRRLAIEEEHQRNAAISGFVNGSKSETSSNDQRLDPSVYSHSRQSIGSIADERDFSRRILQVRNPDRESRASHV